MKKLLTNKKGFTLLELLVVVAIIGILTTIVMVALGDARKKGGDAGVKSNLVAARSQAEVFYNTNSVNANTYTGVCGIPAVGTPPVLPIGSMVLAAAKANGLSTFNTNVAGSTTTATCNSSASAWAAEAPLKEGGMWCVDSTNKSLKTAGSSLATLPAGTDYTCN